MAFIRKRREDPRVELTPMVDVVFLLLIFFMISTTFVETPGISIKLPESSSQMAEKPQEEIKVYFSRSGEITFKEERVSLEELRRRLSGYGEKARTMTFLLLADEEARHGKVVQLMDAAREAGFGKLAIATESPGEKP
jgi:biopolymer transport protein ExbD/biopolymer transport protein TolR